MPIDWREAIPSGAASDLNKSSGSGQAAPSLDFGVRIVICAHKCVKPIYRAFAIPCISISHIDIPNVLLMPRAHCVIQRSGAGGKVVLLIIWGVGACGDVAARDR